MLAPGGKSEWLLNTIKKPELISSMIIHRVESLLGMHSSGNTEKVLPAMFRQATNRSGDKLACLAYLTTTLRIH